MQKILLDLFCGAGGAAAGYQAAGYYVVGVDIHPQPRYIGNEFIQADALAFLEKNQRHFDAFHASPPCQGFSKITKKSNRGNYSNFITPIREKLFKLPCPVVIENVSGAPLKNAVMLCGSMFGLKVYRHRFFECNKLLLVPSHVPHKDKTPSAGSGISPKGFISITSGGVNNLPVGCSPAAYKNMAMGIDWMVQSELTEAIPPAFTRFLGSQLMNYSMYWLSI